jgi:hypothetical protein
MIHKNVFDLDHVHLIDPVKKLCALRVLRGLLLLALRLSHFLETLAVGFLIGLDCFVFGR